jgi:hypothetical protein
VFLVVVVSATGCGDSDTPALPHGVPALVRAGAPDPGGDDRAAVSLPPEARWFGFSGYLKGIDRRPIALEPDQTAADALVAGVNAHRMALPWSAVEPVHGQIDRARILDPARRFADRLERRGARLLIVLGGTPAWASAKPGDAAAAPRDDRGVDEAFAAYAALVARTFPEALAIETWNEPNATSAWRPLTGAGKRYLRLHVAATAAIRKAVPDMRVLLGGLVATHEDRRDVIRPQRFLKEMYAAGLRPEEYDGLAVHLYPGQADGKMLPLGAGSEFAAGLADFRAGYRWRDPRANVWVTEAGVTTSGPEPVRGRVQGVGIVRILRRLFSMAEIEGVFVHTLYEQSDAPASSPERGYGLRTSDGVPKPALCALVDLRAEPRTTPLAGCG